MPKFGVPQITLEGSRDQNPPPDKVGLMNRKVVADDIMNMNLNLIPGFRLIWNYDSNVKAEDKYSKEVKSKYFAR